MATILRLTNGATTIDLNATGGAYALADADWTPAIAAERLDDLGGRGPVAEATEEIPLLVFGATRGALQTNLHALQILLRAAVRAYAFGEGALVCLHYRPDGSTLTADVAAPLYGPPEGERSLTHGPAQAAPGRGFVAEATMRVRRGGLWVSTALDTPVSSAAVTSPNVMTATLPAHDTPSPCLITLAASGGFGWSAGAGTIIPPGLLILTDDPTKILILNAAAGGGDGFTNDSSAGTLARNPRGGAVARYWGGDNTKAFTLPAPFGTKARRLRAYACVRNTGSLAPRLTLFLDAPAATVTARPVLTPGSMMAPAWIDLGAVTLPDDVATAPAHTARIIVGPGVSGTSGFFDIDAVVFVALDEATTVLALDQAGITSSVFGVNALRLRIDPAYTSRPQPLVAVERVSPAILSGIGARGDAFVAPTGTTLAGVYLSAGSVGEGGYDSFRQTDAAGTTVLAHQLTVTRARGYVAVP